MISPPVASKGRLPVEPVEDRVRRAGVDAVGCEDRGAHVAGEERVAAAAAARSPDARPGRARARRTGVRARASARRSCARTPSGTRSRCRPCRGKWTALSRGRPALPATSARLRRGGGPRRGSRRPRRRRRALEHHWTRIWPSSAMRSSPSCAGQFEAGLADRRPAEHGRRLPLERLPPLLREQLAAAEEGARVADDAVRRRQAAVLVPVERPFSRGPRRRAGATAPPRSRARCSASAARRSRRASRTASIVPGDPHMSAFASLPTFSRTRA